MKASISSTILFGLFALTSATPTPERGSAGALDKAPRAIDKKSQGTQNTIVNENDKHGDSIVYFDIGDVPARLPGGEPDKIAHVPK